MSETLSGMAIRLYSALFEAARRTLLPLLAERGRRRGWNLDERQRLPRVVSACPGQAAVWVHAASLGEAKLVGQFLAVLRRRNPSDRYVVTATTRTGVRYLEEMRQPSVCAVGFLPLDTLPLMRSLLRHFRVSRLWLLETELWPCMLKACHDAGVPVGIVNARIEEKSFASYSRFAWALRPLLERLEPVLAQGEAYAQRFRRLGVKQANLHVVGNLKAHLRIRQPSRGERARLRGALRLSEEDRVIVAGCFHAGEGAVLRTCLEDLGSRGRVCKCVVVPRHLEESAPLAAELGGATVRFADAAAASPWNVCTIEKMGVLEPMYQMADAAVVGGTFVNIGGHNPWEAARWGIPVFFGPHTHEQETICEKLLSGGVGFRADGPAALAAGIERALWSEPEKFAATQALFAESVNRQQSVLEPLIP